MQPQDRWTATTRPLFVKALAKTAAASSTAAPPSASATTSTGRARNALSHAPSAMSPAAAREVIDAVQALYTSHEVTSPDSAAFACLDAIGLVLAPLAAQLSTGLPERHPASLLPLVVSSVSWLVQRVQDQSIAASKEMAADALAPHLFGMAASLVAAAGLFASSAAGTHDNRPAGITPALRGILTVLNALLGKCPANKKRFATRPGLAQTAALAKMMQSMPDVQCQLSVLEFIYRLFPRQQSPARSAFLVSLGLDGSDQDLLALDSTTFLARSRRFLLVTLNANNDGLDRVPTSFALQHAKCLVRNGGMIWEYHDHSDDDYPASMDDQSVVLWTDIGFESVSIAVLSVDDGTEMDYIDLPFAHMDGYSFDGDVSVSLHMNGMPRSVKASVSPQRSEALSAADAVIVNLALDHLVHLVSVLEHRGVQRKPTKTSVTTMSLAIHLPQSQHDPDQDQEHDVSRHTPSDVATVVNSPPAAEPEPEPESTAVVPVADSEPPVVVAFAEPDVPVCPPSPRTPVAGHKPDLPEPPAPRAAKTRQPKQTAKQAARQSAKPKSKVDLEPEPEPKPKPKPKPRPKQDPVAVASAVDSESDQLRPQAQPPKRAHQLQTRHQVASVPASKPRAKPSQPAHPTEQAIESSRVPVAQGAPVPPAVPAVPVATSAMATQTSMKRPRSASPPVETHTHASITAPHTAVPAARPTALPTGQPTKRQRTHPLPPAPAHAHAPTAQATSTPETPGTHGTPERRDTRDTVTDLLAQICGVYKDYLVKTLTRVGERLHEAGQGNEATMSVVQKAVQARIEKTHAFGSRIRALQDACRDLHTPPPLLPPMLPPSVASTPV
ncbi:hypothetical protein BC831DRAFT_282744 [Entophlyctis helioformis]|nr:hypothetical protein BC831DRAFT_282744 [Entophlyctis helioformis]